MNEMIQDACLNYIKNNCEIDYAILLKGNWGIGKTYFCNSLCNDLKNNGINVWKISVFGVKSIEEINDKVFELAHPILDKKTLSLGFNALNSFVKHKYAIDLKDISTSINAFFKKNDTSSIVAGVFIIDDIERADIDINTMFGYINPIINDNIRVILIGNEDEIIAKNNSNDYLKYKEKIIGATFEIEPDFEGAVDSFIKNSNLKNFFSVKENKSNLLDTIKCLNLKNLRVIKQILFEWSACISKLDDTFLNANMESLQQIFSIYLILSIQHRLGELDNTDKDSNYYCKVWSVYSMNKISFKLWKSNLEKKPDLEKNQDSTQLNIIASANMFLKDKWESILEKGMISNSSFIKECISIEKEKGENILSTGLSKLQMTFRNLFFFKNDKTQNPQLKNAFNDFISELQNGYYLDYFQIEDGIKICDTLLQNKALPPNYTENYFIDLLDKFLSIHSTEIKAIWRNSLHHNSDDIKSNIIKSKLIEIHHVAENNQSLEIEKKLSHKPEFEKIINDGNYYLYDGIALISHMDIDTLYSWLINDNNLHNSFLYFLSERYFLDSATVFPNIYLSDYTNLNTLYFKVKAECIAKEHSFDCSVLVLNDFITHYQKILKSMDKAKKEIKIIPVPIEK